MEKAARTQSLQRSSADVSALSRQSRRSRPDARVRLAIGELPEDVVQRASDLPARIVGPQATQVADVGDVIAETTGLHVFHAESPPSEVLEARDRLEDRDAVRATAAEIVHSGRSRRLVELEKRRADCRAYVRLRRVGRIGTTRHEAHAGSTRVGAVRSRAFTETNASEACL